MDVVGYTKAGGLLDGFLVLVNFSAFLLLHSRKVFIPDCLDHFLQNASQELPVWPSRRG